MTINNKSERNYRGKCLGWPVTSYCGAPARLFILSEICQVSSHPQSDTHTDKIACDLGVSMQSRRPQKEAGKQKQSSGDQQSVKDLRKLYLGTAFQNLKEQNEELVRDLAEGEADLEELANLVSTKDEAIKNMERRLLHAKKIIADLNAEVQSLRSHNKLKEPDHQQETAQQQSEMEIRCISSHSLSAVVFTVSTRRSFRYFQHGQCVSCCWMSKEHCP